MSRTSKRRIKKVGLPSESLVYTGEKALGKIDIQGPASIKTMATPRRIALCVEGLPAVQSDAETTALGPAKSIAFGPDGYLYVPLGDGGGANDVGEGHAAGGNAQDTTTLLGKILRLDIHNASSGSYAIPPDIPAAKLRPVRPSTTTTPPVSGTDCASVICTSPVPGGKSIKR